MAKRRKTADLWRTISTLVFLKDRTGLGQNVSFVASKKKKKNVHHSFPEPKATSSKVSFCPTNSLKPKYIQFAIIEGYENLQILYEKLCA